VKLGKAAKRANVQKYAVFQNAGYEGLYGMGLADVKRRKRLPSTEDLLDCADRAELAANDFRITQTEAKLDRDHVNTEQNAIHVHRDVGRYVRQAIRNMKGTMPEDLPPATNITKLVSPKRRKELAAAALAQPATVLLKR
jgi:DNA-damage-inducible protein D